MHHEGGGDFQDKTSASTEAIRPTVGPKEPATVAPASSLSAQGPWLFYVRKIPVPGMYDIADVPPELLLLNQDGTGRTPVEIVGCFDGSSQSETYAALAKFNAWLYLVHPAEAAAMLVQEDRPYPTCETYFHGDEKGGLLADLHGVEGEQPELIVYDLPAGTIRDRLPLGRMQHRSKYLRHGPLPVERDGEHRAAVVAEWPLPGLCRPGG